MDWPNENPAVVDAGRLLPPKPNPVFPPLLLCVDGFDAAAAPKLNPVFPPPPPCVDWFGAVAPKLNPVEACGADGAEDVVPAARPKPNPPPAVDDAGAVPPAPKFKEVDAVVVEGIPEACKEAEEPKLKPPESDGTGLAIELAF